MKATLGAALALVVVMARGVDAQEVTAAQIVSSMSELGRSEIK